MGCGSSSSFGKDHEESLTSLDELFKGDVHAGKDTLHEPDVPSVTDPLVSHSEFVASVPIRSITLKLTDVIKSKIPTKTHVEFEIVETGAKRKWHDVEQLRSALSHAYPCALVPPLTMKSANTSSTAIENVSKVDAIQRFLRAVSSNPYFASDPNWEAFLTSPGFSKNEAKSKKAQSNARWMEAVKLTVPPSNAAALVSTAHVELMSLKHETEDLARELSSFGASSVKTASHTVNLGQKLESVSAFESATVGTASSYVGGPNNVGQAAYVAALNVTARSVLAAGERARVDASLTTLPADLAFEVAYVDALLHMLSKAKTAITTYHSSVLRYKKVRENTSAQIAVGGKAGEKAVAALAVPRHAVRARQRDANEAVSGVMLEMERFRVGRGRRLADALCVFVERKRQESELAFSHWSELSKDAHLASKGEFGGTRSTPEVVVVKEPKIVAEEPKVVVEEPMIVAEEPKVVAEEPEGEKAEEVVEEVEECNKDKDEEKIEESDEIVVEEPEEPADPEKAEEVVVVSDVEPAEPSPEETEP